MDTSTDILLVEKKIRKIIESQLNFRITNKMMGLKIKAEIGIDSLNELFIVEMIEKLFHIRITDEDSETFKTINDIVQFVKKETYYHSYLLN